jgi:cyclopropane fatty-acyl-phospholipid synthase-like methyltransferase
MIWAIFNDLIQRIVTFNKLEQKNILGRRLEALSIPKGSKVLDFGCGTGLFAKCLTGLGLRYCGYDIDRRLISYASRLYGNCKFIGTKDELVKEAPFDLIIANCCFHHINDATVQDELRDIEKILDRNGTFMMIDILSNQNDDYFPRKAFRRLELGQQIRSFDDYRKNLEQYFRISRSDIVRSHLFSIRNCPIYNDLATFECRINHHP